MTPATSKVEYFVTKVLGNASPKEQLRKLQRKKMNIAAVKYPRTNTLKILDECFFFFQSKTLC